jgi:hypothetical protein
MVVESLAVGGFVGVGLSGGFIYYEIGKFAEPQVPRTLFDERRLIFAFTIGLFAGIPLAFPLILLYDSLAGGVLLLAIIALGTLVGGIEVAQALLVRHRYFGGDAMPFYALGLRTGIVAILILTTVAGYTTFALGDWPALVLVAAESVALLFLAAAGALLSIRGTPGSGRTGGGPFSGALFGALGFFLIGLGPLLGPLFGTIGAIIAAFGGFFLYRRLRPAVLERVTPPVPPGPKVADEEPEATPTRYGRVVR